MKHREHVAAVLDGFVAVLLLILAVLARAWILAPIAAAWGVVGVAQLQVARRVDDVSREPARAEDRNALADQSELDQHPGSEWGA